MKQYIEFELQGQQTPIIIEVEDVSDSYGTTKTGRIGEATEKAKKTFEQAIETIEPVAKSLMERLRSLEPDEVEVSFGVKLTKQLSAVIASGGAEANFNVKLKWQPKRHNPIYCPN